MRQVDRLQTRLIWSLGDKTGWWTGLLGCGEGRIWIRSDIGTVLEGRGLFGGGEDAVTLYIKSINVNAIVIMLSKVQ